MYSPTVLEYAYLSSDVYHMDDQHSAYKYLHNHDWRRISQRGIDPIMAADQSLYARLYIHLDRQSRADAAVVAYRGTVPSRLGNLVDDVDLGLNITPNDTERAVKYFVRASLFAMHTYKIPCALTGHSLGGVLAQLVAIKLREDTETVVFNSPGAAGLIGDGPNKKYPYIHNYVSAGGVINRVGSRAGDTTSLNVSPVNAGPKITENLSVSSGAVGIMAGSVATLTGGLMEHGISHIIAALDNKPEIANERF